MDENSIMKKDRDGYCSKHQKAAWWCRECLQEYQDQSKKDGIKIGITQGKREAWEPLAKYCKLKRYDVCAVNGKPCDFSQCPAIKISPAPAKDQEG